MSTTTPTHGREDLHGSEEVDFYNPGQRHYDELFNGMAANLKDVEERGDAVAAAHAVNKKAAVKSPAPAMNGSQRKENRSFNKAVLMKLASSKKLRGKSSLATLLLLLFGGGGFLTVFFSPSLALINMKEVLTENLNDQLHTVNERSSILLRSKLKDMTNGSCGEIKIKCRFSTMTDKQVEKFKAAGIEIKTVPKEERRWFNGNRGQILEINYVDPDGVTSIKSAAELHNNLLNNVAFRSAMMKGYNPLFASLSDKVALNVMRSLKTSKSLVVSGDSDEERQKKIDAAVGGIENGTDKSVVIKRDENGKELYYDSDGNELTKAEYDAAKEQSARIEEYSKNGGTSGVLKNAVKGASIVGYMDSACTVYNSFRLVSGLSKVEKAAQAARFATAMVLTPADANKAGDINPADLEFVGNSLMAAHPEGIVIDPAKINDPGSAANPATIADPEAGMNAMDGPGYRMAAYGEAPDLSPRASQYMIGGGSVAMLDGVLGAIATIVNLGDPNPQGVSEKCGYIQNPVVRFTGLAIGIIAGVGTFGLVTALSIGGSTAIALALPFLESQAAGVLAGDVFKGINGVDAGDAAVVGTVALFGSIAKARGMKPMSAQEGMAYANASQATIGRYVESQQYLARATPFDTTNKYSFMGSIAHTLMPLAQRSKTTASAAMINMASIVPTAFSQLVKPASADRTLDENYYNKCNDAGYKTLGLGADVFCGIHYGISEKDLQLKPADIVDYMAANGEIDTESEYGDPKDNGRAWNYVKFLKECPNRTVGWGENQSENEGDGRACISPENEEQNRYYRLYTIDKSVDASMDGDTVVTSAGENPQDDGISNQGWTFPTANDATIKVGFQTPTDPQHDGVDISSAAIIGQPVYAARDGIVTDKGDDKKLGTYVVIEHTVDGKMLSTKYGNLQPGSVTVSIGDAVTGGQTIAKVGRSGENGTPHLHFEVWDGSPVGSRGKAIEPTPIIEASRRRSMM